MYRSFKSIVVSSMMVVSSLALAEGGPSNNFRGNEVCPPGPPVFIEMPVNLEDGFKEKLKPSALVENNGKTAREAVRNLMTSLKGPHKKYRIENERSVEVTGGDDYVMAYVPGGEVSIVKLPVTVSGITVYSDGEGSCKRFFATATISSVQ